MAKVFTSSVINAPVGEVWAAIRDFNGLPDWHPVIARSEIEEGRDADAVGCVRSFYLQDGAHIREQQLALSDVDRSVTYSILDSPLALEGYVATLSLAPITDGDRTFAQWSAEFTCAAADEAGLVDLVGNGVFQGGFDALKERFGG
jgi:hypothetical protein